ncbi:MAG: indole-3-glycerol phosphate synthase TrpC [Chloroflexota bacterium]|nr:indole-3-glycerol phosphate synthase TrpC [Chloroflexota bacterium]
MTFAETGSILDTILARTVADLAERSEMIPLASLDAAAATSRPALSLRRSLDSPGISIIAEIKRASPSRGMFPVAINPAEVAAEYIAGGTAAISVLTDAPFFQGSLDDLEMAAKVAHAHNPGVPILRKDFVVDSYQIVEARCRGADAVLLIVAALSDEALSTLLAVARRWEMDALVEVHNERDLARAIEAGAEIIGINNRDLATFSVDLGVTERLAPLVPPNAIVVAESGILGPAEVARMELAGAQAVLVGEGLIVADHRAEAVRGLRTWLK